MNAPRPTGLVSRKAAVPRSFSAGHRAHRQDDRGERAELAEVLLELEDGVGRRRRRDRDRQLVAEGRLEDLGQVARGERRQDPDRREQDHHDRQPARPPRLDELLAQEHPEPGHATPLRRPGQLEEHVLERRPDPLHAADGQLGGDDRWEQLARRAGRVADRDPDAARARPRRRSPSRSSAGPRPAGPIASAWPGSGSTR